MKSRAEAEILFNKLAQNKIPLKDGLKWFENLPREMQLNRLRELATFVTQAHPSKDELYEAARQVDIPHTASVFRSLSKNDNPCKQMHKACLLPISERPVIFMLFIGLLTVADGRRKKNSCSEGCKHWWHQKLF